MPTLPPDKRKSVQRTFRFYPAHIALLDEWAAAEGKTRTQILTGLILDEEVRRIEEAQPPEDLAAAIRAKVERVRRAG